MKLGPVVFAPLLAGLLLTACAGGFGEQAAVQADRDDVSETTVLTTQVSAPSSTTTTTTSPPPTVPVTEAPPPPAGPTCSEKFFAGHAGELGEQFTFDRHRCKGQWAGAAYLNELSGSVVLVVFQGRGDRWEVFGMSNMAHRSTAEWVAMGVPKDVVGSFIDEEGGLELG